MSDVDAVHPMAPALESVEIPDDRAILAGADRVLLIVENDENFARFLVDLAHENGFKARRGDARAPTRSRSPRASRASTRSRSTSSCPSSTAGGCSTG